VKENASGENKQLRAENRIARY
jgi:hypothetical protein